MNNRGIRLTITLALLLLALGLGTWLFINEIADQFRTNSIRTITESTRQGANALNLQFEADLRELNAIGENLAKANSNQLQHFGLWDMLGIYNIVDPDVMLHHHSEKRSAEFGKPDTAACRQLQGSSREQGILDTHFNTVTEESVFDLFLRISLSDDMESFLLKEYQAVEVAKQFTLSFYDNVGFSYLVNRSGDIMVRSSHKNSNKTDSNLFDMISSEENEPRTIRSFRDNIRQLKSGWAAFSCEGDSTIFCYEPLRADSNWLLVSVVPENVIVDQTNEVLLKAILFSGMFILAILIVVTYFYVAKQRQNKQHTAQLEQALEAADAASRAKGRFLMNMSHDIRTPLNAILGMTMIAQEYLAHQARVTDCLQKIEVSGTQLLTLINDVLDMSEIENGTMVLKEEPVQLARLVTDTAELMRSQARACKADLSLELLPIHLHNETVMGDPDRIRQVLINIISNAIKYSPDGGHITLELTQAKVSTDGTAGTAAGAASENVFPADGAVDQSPKGLGVYRFRCTDTGIGMSPEFLERMFLPFERDKDTTNSKVAGAGVGLTITKSLLELMGGTIQAESEPGKGSTFRVELPLRLPERADALDGSGGAIAAAGKETGKGNAPETQFGDRSDAAGEAEAADTAAGAAAYSESDPAAPQVSAAEEQGEPDYSHRRILLVEDNELNMEIAEEMIGILEAQVEKAFDGQEAVDMFCSSPCGYYDLIFMDIQMPVMNGYDATRRIRATDREDAATIPIFAMSANAFAEDVENSLASGMNGHIAKPIDLDPIEKVFREYFL